MGVGACRLLPVIDTSVVLLSYRPRWGIPSWAAMINGCEDKEVQSHEPYGQWPFGAAESR